MQLLQVLQGIQDAWWPAGVITIQTGDHSTQQEQFRRVFEEVCRKFVEGGGTCSENGQKLKLYVGGQEPSGEYCPIAIVGR